MEKFECDKCHKIFHPNKKKATLELIELGADTLPHAHFRQKLDICIHCFEALKAMFQALPEHSE
jgi:hypothetical protein